MKYTSLILACFFIAICSAAPFSLTRLISSRKDSSRDINRDNCVIWSQEKCEQCIDGYEPDAEGTCIENVQVQLPEDIIDDDELGETVSEGFIPCRGALHCAESQGFKNANEFNEFIRKYQPEQNTQNIMRRNIQPNSFSAQSTTIQKSSMAQRSEAAPQPAADRDFSGTNNQQENVDEADILKTDGTYIYTISNGVLSITRAYPANKLGVLSEIEMDGLRPSALFIEGNYLAVFGTRYENQQPYYQSYQKSAYLYRPYIQPSRPYTFIKVYDVSNRARPYLVKNFEVEGNYFNGRKTSDGYVYLLSTTRIYQRSYVMPWYNFGGRKINFSFRNIFYYPGIYRSPLFVSIFTFNLRDPLSNRRGYACLITESAQTLYMSQKSIYISYTDYNKGSDTSVIHKVYVRKTRIIPFADGRVNGRINNQFSMDEYYQVLRVATTSNSFRTSSNNVYALDYFMNEIGSLNGIAKGERIFSARFVEKRLYLVTFRQIDPFFVISFRSHRRPKILGQLKITGFSRYLHPYDQNTIVGLGRQADLNGRQQGLKISLFDVTNVRNPRQIDSFQLQEKYASSRAEWEHKAFLLSRSKNIMVIPGTMNYKDTKFNGAFVFYIDSNTIQLRGIIDHLISDSDQFYKRNVERSLYIEELLYTKSQCLIRVNKLRNLDKVKDIKIPCEPSNTVKPKPIYRIDPVPLPQPIEPVRPVQPVWNFPVFTRYGS